MNERPFGHAPGHARHDRLLVARFAVGDAVAAEAAEAGRLVDQCADCARLAEDIRLLSTSLALLPTPARTRNFRLTEAQADALRGNPLERFLRRLTAPGLGMLRPVAGVAMAMGMTLAVVGAGLPLAAAGPTAAPAVGDMNTPREAAGSPTDAYLPAAVATDKGSEAYGTFTLSGAPQPAATEATAPDLPPNAGGSSSGSGRTGEGPDASTAPETQEDSIVATPTDSDVAGPTTLQGTGGPPDGTRVLLIYGGVTLAMLSFGVLLLAWYARRRLEDPLLR